MISIVLFSFKAYKDYQQSNKIINVYGVFLHDGHEVPVSTYTDKIECEYDVKLYNAIAKIIFLDKKYPLIHEQSDPNTTVFPGAECTFYYDKNEKLVVSSNEFFKKQISEMKELIPEIQEAMYLPADHLFDENEPIIWTDDKILDWASRMDDELVEGKKYAIFTHNKYLKDELNGYGILKTSREVIRGYKTMQECKEAVIRENEKKEDKNVRLFCGEVETYVLKDKENKNASEKWELVLATISKEEAESYKAYADTLGVTDNSSKIKNFGEIGRAHV